MQRSMRSLRFSTTAGSYNDNWVRIQDSVRSCCAYVLVMTPDFAYAKTCYDAMIGSGPNRGSNRHRADASKGMDEYPDPHFPHWRRCHETDHRSANGMHRFGPATRTRLAVLDRIDDDLEQLGLTLEEGRGRCWLRRSRRSYPATRSSGLSRKITAVDASHRCTTRIVGLLSYARYSEKLPCKARDSGPASAIGRKAPDDTWLAH